MAPEEQHTRLFSAVYIHMPTGIIPPHKHMNMHMQYREENKPTLAFETMQIFIASKISS